MLPLIPSKGRKQGERMRHPWAFRSLWLEYSQFDLIFSCEVEWLSWTWATSIFKQYRTESWVEIIWSCVRYYFLLTCMKEQLTSSKLLPGIWKKSGKKRWVAHIRTYYTDRNILFTSLPHWECDCNSVLPSEWTSISSLITAGWMVLLDGTWHNLG